MHQLNFQRGKVFITTIMAHGRSKKRAEHESFVLQALQGISKKKWKSPAQAAKALEICYQTIARRLKGGKSIAQSREAAQLLTIPEEKALVGSIIHLTMTGYPATHAFIRELAEEI